MQYITYLKIYLSIQLVSRRGTYDIGEGRDGGIARSLELECGAQRIAGSHAQHRPTVAVLSRSARHALVGVVRLFRVLDVCSCGRTVAKLK